MTSARASAHADGTDGKRWRSPPAMSKASRRRRHLGTASAGAADALIAG
jgi:hypothetical protein